MRKHRIRPQRTATRCLCVLLVLVFTVVASDANGPFASLSQFIDIDIDHSSSTHHTRAIVRLALVGRKTSDAHNDAT